MNLISKIIAYEQGELDDDQTIELFQSLVVKEEEDGTSGQDRESYTDEQDRESYIVTND